MKNRRRLFRAFLLVLLFLVLVVGAGVEEAILRYRGLSPHDPLFHGEFEMYHPMVSHRLLLGDRTPSNTAIDPVFGWVSTRYPLPNVRPFPIVAIGDSFTFGAESPIGDEWPAHVSRILGQEVLNLGVPGYGTDQAAMLYLARGRPYKPRLVVWGVFGDDLRRAGVHFLNLNPKPRYVGETVIPPPCMTQAGALELLAEEERRPRSLFLGLLRGIWGRQVSDRLRRQEVITQFIDFAKKIEETSHLLVVFIPHVAEATDLEKAGVAAARATGLDVLDLRDEFPEDRRGFYTYPEGPSAAPGHWNAAGNALAGRIIASRVAATGRDD